MKKLEIDFFNDLVDKFGTFEEFTDEQYNEYISRLVNEAEISPTDTVLELGCGTGAFTSRISTLGYEIIGLDISDKMLSKAKKNLKSYYVQADMECLPFSDNNLDVVFSSASLHHLSTLDPCISEVFRVLKKGGRFFSIDPNGLNPLSWAEMRVPFIRNTVCKKYMRKLGCSPNEKIFTPRKLSKALDEAGFKNIKVYTVNVIPFREYKFFKTLNFVFEKAPVFKKFGGTIGACSVKL